MRALVTGAGGFIGSAVTRELISRDWSVTALARSDKGVPDDVEGLLEVDLNDPGQSARTLRGRGFEVVVHAAARMAGTAAALEPGGFSKNLEITRNLLGALNESWVDQLANVSSIDVYGSAFRQGPVSERSPVSPLTEYAKSKLLSEQLCEFWARSRGSVITHLRLTQVFGPGDRGRKFIPSVIEGIREQRRVELVGDGTDARDYLFVNDAARMIVDCIERRCQGPLNLATGHSTTLKEVLTQLEDLAPEPFEIEQRPRRREVSRHRLDISRLIAAIGKTPLTPFESALRRTYDSIG